MSFRDWFVVPSAAAATLTAAAAAAPAGVGLTGYNGYDGVSVNSGALATIVLGDVLPDDIANVLSAEVTPDAALEVPAVSAAVNLIAGLISRQPLKVYKDGEPLPAQPSWAYRTSGAVPPSIKIFLTIEDLMLTGWSCWFRVNGADRFPIDTTRIPLDRWKFDSHGRVLVDNEPVDALDVILFYGPVQGGLCRRGRRVICAARDLESTRAARLRAPSPITEIHVTDDGLVSDESEVEQLQKNWVDARRTLNGAVTVTPSWADVRFHGDVPTDYMTEAANAQAVSIAQILGVPASAIDAAVGVADSTSLTYANLQQNQSWLLQTSVPLWMEPITARLSMDDVVPRGQSVSFDISALLAVPEPSHETAQD